MAGPSRCANIVRIERPALAESAPNICASCGAVAAGVSFGDGTEGAGVGMAIPASGVDLQCDRFDQGATPAFEQMHLQLTAIMVQLQAQGCR
ncbi:hypothetical protein SBBP1_1080004 [Burkholderiales bacterium]|nr:hypothetical protein SBBP1_1080004 [Burkholderiales bacterium]